jgi:hypothetical protein
MAMASLSSSVVATLGRCRMADAVKLINAANGYDNAE